MLDAQKQIVSHFKTRKQELNKMLPGVTGDLGSDKKQILNSTDSMKTLVVGNIVAVTKNY